jgi:phosphocarrier protein HPr
MGLLYRKGSRAAQAQKIEKELTIVNRLGLHARPAAMFVRIASRHRAEIWVSKEGEEVNGKSIMGLMMLAAGQGSKLRIRCDGPDADKAMEELEATTRKSGLKELAFRPESPSAGFMSSAKTWMKWCVTRLRRPRLGMKSGGSRPDSSKRVCRSLRCSSGLPNRSAPKTRRFSMPICSWSRTAR